MNHLVKIRVKSSFTLYEFVGSLDTIMLALHDKEVLKDHEDSFAPPHLVTNLSIESSLLKKYTSEAFAISPNQVKMNINYFIRSINTPKVCP